MYKFIYTKDDTNIYDIADIIMLVDTVDRQDLICQFISFLAANGFSVEDLKDIHGL